MTLPDRPAPLPDVDAPPPDVIARHNELFDWYTDWSLAHPGEDPDSDPGYVARADEIMRSSR